MKTYPHNTLNHYVTALSNRIELDGDWEVALSEILLQRTWYNIQEDECMLCIITPGNEIDIYLPEGFYSDVYQLIDRCNRMIERNLKDAGTIVYFEKISVHVGADNVVTLSSELASIMGFSARQLTFRGERKHKGKVAMNPCRGFNSLYVYCDAAGAIPVADIKAPLLRVVYAAGNFGDLIHRLYTTPQYVPVSRKEFNTVEIHIRDDAGRPAPFEFGKVVATLHFRQPESVLLIIMRKQFCCEASRALYEDYYTGQ